MIWQQVRTGRTRVLQCVLLTFAFGAACAAAPSDAPELKLGGKAPHFTLKDIKGKAYSLKDYRGKKLVLLDFGRFMCQSCQFVIHDLQKLREKYKDKPVQIFSVNLDGPLASRIVPQGIEHFHLTFPVLLDTDYKVTESYKVETIPYLVLIDTTGVVRFTHAGYDSKFEEMLSKQFDKYLPKGRKSPGRLAAPKS